MGELNCTICANRIKFNEGDKFVACTKCFSYQGIGTEVLKFVSASDLSRKPTEICFELGQILSIKGTEYHIMGITMRCDAAYQSHDWREYHLKDTIGDEAFLSEYNGNWLLAKPLTDISDISVSYSVHYKGLEYALFQKYKQKIKWAIGNFSFDIKEDEKTLVREFIAPPCMVILDIEKDANNFGKEHIKEAYFAEYVEADEVYQQYLNLNNKHLIFPNKYGVGATETSKRSFSFDDILPATMIAVIGLICFSILGLFLQSTERIFYGSFNTADMPYDSTQSFYSTKQPIVSESFTMKHDGKIEVELQSTVDNSWLESNITMVNEKTLQELPIVLGNEFYHGVEGGYSWTEGSATASKDYSAVPEGKYHLLIETASPNLSGTYSIAIVAGGAYWVNFFVTIILIAIIPIYVYSRDKEFERRRWADSDFSPYAVDEE
jgi:hypothetical protein